MSAGQFHRPKPAEVVNAFERIRHKTPSIFCTPKDVATHNRKAGQIAAKAVLKDSKQQIVYSKARASR